MPDIALELGYSREHKIVRILLICRISLKERENKQNKYKTDECYAE